MNINIVTPLDSQSNESFLFESKQLKVDQSSEISKLNDAPISTQKLNNLCNSTSSNNSMNLSYTSKYKIMKENQKKGTKQMNIINITSFQSPQQKAVYINEDNSQSCLKGVPNYRISFLIDQIGQDKVNKLLNLIETSSNPVQLLNGDGKEIQTIVGNNYKKVQNFLKNFIMPVNIC
jgi:hypothetical protein